MKKTLQEEQKRFHQIVKHGATNMAYGFKPNQNDESHEEDYLPPDIHDIGHNQDKPKEEKGYQSYHENKEFRDFLGKILWELRPHDRNDGAGYSIYADRVVATLEKKYPRLKKM